MNQVTRTAEQLTKAEKLFNEMIAEERDMETLLGMPHELGEALEEEVRGAYDAWKTGDPSNEASAFQDAYEKWEAQGEPTPALTEKANAQEQA